jgi:hypothetical protein
MKRAIMSMRRGWLNLLTVGIVTGTIVSTSGQLTAQEPAGHTNTALGHSLQTDPSQHAALSGTVPSACRDHVYLFFVNGIDVLGAANFRGLCGYVQAQGYRQAYFAQMTQGNRIVRRIRQIRQEDAQARIVLVGFSAGTYVVRDVAHALKEDGIPVALLAYIGGDFLQNSPDCRPCNVGKIVNITGHGFLLSGGDLFNGSDLDGAVNLRLPCRHMLLPSRRETIDLLVRELTATATADGTTTHP